MRLKQFLSLFIIVYTIPLFAQNQYYDDTVRINHIQVLGSHNSYKRMPDAGILKTIHLIDPFYNQKLAPAMHLEYEHIPIDSQLEYYGMNSLELDIYYDPIGGRYYNRQGNALRFKSTKSHVDALLQPGMKIMHIADVDYNTNYYTLKQALYTIKNWSSMHVNHLPIYVMIELKEEAVGDRIKIAGFKSALPFTMDAILDLKKEIEVVFQEHSEQILYPDSIRSNFPSIRLAIDSIGYPQLSDAKGKIVFILMTNQSLNTSICAKYPSYRSLPFFTFSQAGNDETVFIKCDDPITEFNSIRSYIQQGYIVRTRSDVETEEARQNNYSKFYMAKKSGAQIISTDYYKPFPKTGFVINNSLLHAND